MATRDLPGPGGRGQDDVGAGDQLHDGLVLGGVEGQAAGLGPLDKPGVELVRVQARPAGDTGGRGGELINEFHCCPA